jgi:hypothetical protein
MKQTIKLTLLGSVMAVAFSGCLKDKGYDNGEYGVEVIERKGVSFPQSTTSPISISLLPSTTPTLMTNPYVTLETIGAQSSDVNVKIALDSNLVLDAGLTVLPYDEFTFNENINIEAGTLKDSVSVSLLNTDGLDKTANYGIGFVLVSADNGFQVASNMRTVVIQINIRNIYDGIVELRGKTFHPSNATLAGRVSPYETTLVTSGATSVVLGEPHRWADGSGSILSGAINPQYTVDGLTREITITNAGTDPVANVVTNNPGYDSYYDQVTQTMFAEWTYNGRIFTDTIVWLGPR